MKNFEETTNGKLSTEPHHQQTFSALEAFDQFLRQQNQVQMSNQQLNSSALAPQSSEINLNTFRPSQTVQVAGINLNVPSYIAPIQSIDLFNQDPNTLFDDPTYNFPFLSSFRSFKNLNTDATAAGTSDLLNLPTASAQVSVENTIDFNAFNFSKRSVEFFTDISKTLPGSVAGLDLSNSNNQLSSSTNTTDDDLELKRKANLFTSSRNLALFPLGSSLRKSSSNLLNNISGALFQKRQRNTASEGASEAGEAEDPGGAVEGGKHYSRIENIVLVGEIYTQLFINPALKKSTWIVIAKNFADFFKKNSDNTLYQLSCVRSKGALERHFKVLKEMNRKEGGVMFANLYEEYRQLKLRK